MEEAASTEITARPLHPYTKLLYESSGGRILQAPSQVVATPARPRGCPFAPRCPLAVDRCQSEIPLLRPIGPEPATGPHKVACHRV